MSNNKGERGMWKNRNKIWLTIIVAFVCMFGSVGMAFAAETGTPVTTESMEIRTGEKVGLRTISAVDKAYVEKLRSEGKNVTYGTVALPATVLEKVNGTLEIGKSYTYNKKVYKVLNIPGEEIWKTTEDKIYFTGVLTGISGSGFNTRYAVRSYISVDGKVILKVETTDNKVYTVSTSTFAKDDTYTFSIKLESGKIIQEEFSYKVDCPTVSNATVLRSEATRAEFDLFDVDEGGYVYVYIPGHTQVSKAVDIPSVETVKKGYKQQIKTGFNKVMIRGLESGISYQLYYVLEAHDGRSSEVLGPIAISGSVQEDPNISEEYSIVSVGEKPKNTITIVLNKAPEEELTLDNFSFICPTDSEITIDKAQLKVSEDKKTYTIVIPDNYGHKDNQYTAKVTFQDGTVAKKTFTVEYTPPRITNQKVERISETEVRYSFTSDEDGVLYYGTYTWNDESNASWNNTPTGKEILSGAVASTKVQMHAGQNTVEFTYNGTDKDIFAFYVDEKGNYAGYTEHKEIPAYVPPVKPDESKPAIESIVYNKDLSDSWTTCLDVTFTTGIDWLPNQKLIQIQVIEGSSPGKVLWSTEFLDGEQKKLRMTTMNGAFKTGTYKMSMYIEKDGQLLKVEKEFTID